MEVETFAVTDVSELEVTEIDDISEYESDVITTEVTEIYTTSDTLETTFNYLSEIAENTKTTSVCLSYLSGFTVILTAILISSVIIKVFFSHNDF